MTSSNFAIKFDFFFRSFKELCIIFNDHLKTIWILYFYTIHIWCSHLKTTSCQFDTNIFCKLENDINHDDITALKSWKDLPNNLNRFRNGRLYLWCTRHCTLHSDYGFWPQLYKHNIFRQFAIHSNGNGHVNSDCRLNNTRMKCKNCGQKTV